MLARSIRAFLVALLATACNSDGKRYSDNPVDALQATKDYLVDQPNYGNSGQLASLSAGKIDLGKKLFLDPRLSHNGNLSCATCHNPKQAYTQNGRALPPGASRINNARNAPSLYDLVARSTFFHDGRATSLEEQVVGPLLGQREMKNASMEALAVRIRGMADYDRFFDYAFGTTANPQNIAAALGAYQRTLITGPNRFDLWKYQNKQNPLNESQLRGYALFIGKGRCASCHLIGESSAPFTDENFHNTGYSELYSNANFTPDIGRFAVTGKPEDKYAFRTPSLRNVALTGPYMHDGRLNSLLEVVTFFNDAYELELDVAQRRDLVAFLNSLTSIRRP